MYTETRPRVAVVMQCVTRGNNGVAVVMQCVTRGNTGVAVVMQCVTRRNTGVAVVMQCVTRRNTGVAVVMQYVTRGNTGVAAYRQRNWTGRIGICRYQNVVGCMHPQFHKLAQWGAMGVGLWGGGGGTENIIRAVKWGWRSHKTVILVKIWGGVGRRDTYDCYFS